MAQDYNIARPAGTCSQCGRLFEPDEEYMAVLTEPAEGFQRHDWCLDCWEKADPASLPDLIGTWHTRMPRPREKKKLFVDDALLVNFFERLEGAEEQAKQNFRFVLALILMRKRLLTYERSVKDDQGRELWSLKLRGGRQCELYNPQLDDERIAEVNEQLSQILEGEL